MLLHPPSASKRILCSAEHDSHLLDLPKQQKARNSQSLKIQSIDGQLLDMPFVGSTKFMAVQQHHCLSEAEDEDSDSGLTVIPGCFFSSPELGKEEMRFGK